MRALLSLTNLNFVVFISRVLPFNPTGPGEIGESIVMPAENSGVRVEFFCPCNNPLHIPTIALEKPPAAANKNRVSGENQPVGIVTRQAIQI